MDDAHDGTYAREPQLDDLARIARALNAHGAKYVLIGGFAVIAHGGARTTKDIDLLIDAEPENVARVREALQVLEDKAVRDVGDDDVARYSVVRVADEIVIDLMARACGVDYADASRDAVAVNFGDVSVPVASPSTLIRTKDTPGRPMRPTASSCVLSSTKPEGEGKRPHAFWSRRPAVSSGSFSGPVAWKFGNVIAEFPEIRQHRCRICPARESRGELRMLTGAWATPARSCRRSAARSRGCAGTNRTARSLRCA